MFVYKKDSLKTEFVPVRGDIAAMRMTHEPSGVIIDFEFSTDENEDLASDPKFLSADGKKVNMLGPYKIYKVKENQKYLFYEEVFDAKKDLVNNFKEAIGVFEQRIFEQLNEPEPQPTNEQSTPSTNDDKFSALPMVGDFVKVGSRFGRVVDVDETTRMVKIDKMSEKEVMKILRAQKNQAIGQAGGQDDYELLEDVFDDGGIVSIDEGFFVVQVDEQGANLTILRIQEPAQPSEAGSQQGDEGEQGEPQPDNVEDPFEDNDSEQEQGQDGESEEGSQQEDQDSEESEQGDDQGGDDGSNEESDQGNDQGDSQDGDTGDSAGDDSSDSDEGSSNEGDTSQEGDESTDENRGEDKGGKGGNDFGDDEFDDDELFTTDDLDAALKDVQKQLENQEKEGKELKTQGDLQQFARALSLTADNIADNFLTKKELRAVIGDRQIFSSDNKERIDNVINLIFSKK